ncbi:VUT family protein [Devosia sp. J2-20]|jgi:queuosine precursor transporter|uniref:Probable queuosine precursor transporter n=1 Tax=Devosia litorisediminis TaxID=2829817 RepID=A0A942ED84_9HYPH|nr:MULTISPECIES: VUT family protein [Devosia]MBS3850107.1 VUT family protein [Devosia litorisediminis]MCZ4347594.1 VUT family protein [Devosia neptuniae]WDQ99882.1 VUT family protein [Devosia sp. J2-20]|tara:strand:- start:86403 stop:87038 length:636 start_codon:yes stop_codon:yes gene_type:complete
MLARFSVALAAMVAVVAASNFLVQFPVDIQMGPIHLGDILTWGAFTYPVAFLITDLTNRTFGPARARVVVMAGFAVAVLISIYLATPRIAIASGTAFLTAQFLDISIFDRLRTSVWWKAPVVSSLIGSAIDTVIFFSLAFAAPFAVLDSLFGREDGSLAFPAPLLGVGPEVELWVSLGLGDFLVKLLLAALLLVPYKSIRDWLAGREAVAA